MNDERSTNYEKFTVVGARMWRARANPVNSLLWMNEGFSSYDP